MSSKTQFFTSVITPQNAPMVTADLSPGMCSYGGEGHGIAMNDWKLCIKNLYSEIRRTRMGHPNYNDKINKNNDVSDLCPNKLWHSYESDRLTNVF